MNRTIENLDEQNPVLIAEYRLLNALYLNPQNFLETGVERDVFVHETCKDTFDAFNFCSQKMQYSRMHQLVTLMLHLTLFRLS